jgi:hypothetical protein
MGAIKHSALGLAQMISAAVGVKLTPKRSRSEQRAEHLASMKQMLVDVASCPPDTTRYRSRRRG